MNDFIHFLRNIMTDLYENNVHSLLVEGGACLHQSFIDEGLWDEVIVETSPVCLKSGVRAAGINAVKGAQIVDKYNVSKFISSRGIPSVVERYINQSV